MNIENFCCAAAELQNKMTQTTKMSQIYYYRAFGEETGNDMLSEGFFNQAQDRVKVNDIIIAYYPADGNNTLICWLKVTSNFGGNVTVEPFIADATLKAYVDSITPPLEDIFYATYGETTYSEITDALDDGKTVFCRYTVDQDVYEAVLEASQNGLYQFTHGKVYLDGEKTESYLETFSVDTNDDWETDSIYLQEKLVSGNNIKTVNNESLLGSGNVDVGTVKSVNNNQPDANGDVTLSIPVVNDGTLTIRQGGEEIGSFSANTPNNVVIDINAGGGLEIGDVGIAPFGIDETENKRRYLNGQVISQAQFVTFTNKLKAVVTTYPALATSEVNWQATVTNSDLGQCGQFVIDDDAGTIRLPKVVNINGLQNLAYLGAMKEAGLPNIYTEIATRKFESGVGTVASVTGAGTFNNDGYPAASNVYTYGNGTSTYSLQKTAVDASVGNSIYGNSDTVQQEAVQYPYFIQVATGVETSIDVSEQIKLNLPFSLLEYKYSEYELDNASWLISNGQYNSGATYPAVYNLLLAIYNGTTTKAGVSVKLSTEAYTDTDFVLNTGDTTFRLPLKVLMAGSKRISGNGNSLGLTVGTSYNYGLATDSSPSRLSAYTTAYDKPIPTTGLSGGTYPDSGKAVGVTTDETKSGIETSANGLYLYFYVGETIQDANIIAAAGVLTDVADLKNASNFSQTGLSTLSGLGMPSSTYDDLTFGASGTEYTAPANGWFCINYNMTSNSSYAGLNIDGYAFVINGATQYNAPFMFPCKKGGKIKLNYINATATLFRFYYAQGEV